MGYDQGLHKHKQRGVGAECHSLRVDCLPAHICKGLPLLSVLVFPLQKNSKGELHAT